MMSNDDLNKLLQLAMINNEFNLKKEEFKPDNNTSSETLKMGQYYHDIYQAYIDSGFDDEQAFALLTQQIDGMFQILIAGKASSDDD